MTLLERLTSRLTRRPNSLKPGGRHTTFVYTKPVEQWNDHDRENWQNLVVKDKIEGLEKRIEKTTGTHRASLTEVFKSAQDEVTKAKFE